MDASQPVTCPLCGALVRDKPAADASDIHALERHLAEGCDGAASNPRASGASAA